MQALKEPSDGIDKAGSPLERVQIHGLLSPEVVSLEGHGEVLVTAANLVRTLVQSRIGNPDSYLKTHPNSPSKLKPITLEEVRARLQEALPEGQMATLKIEVSSMLTD